MVDVQTTRRGLLGAMAVGPIASLSRDDKSAVTAKSSRPAIDTVNVRDFGAVGDGVNDDTDAFLQALASLTNDYESSRALYLPSGIYRVISTISVSLAKLAPLHIYSHGKATILADVPDGHWVIDVDYATGATANFLPFNMTNISISDTTNTRRKNGLRMQRVIGAKFTQCEFNFLNVAVDMGNDSNLNTFDTCMWRGNRNGWKSTASNANNNVFLNCQWRYHTGTAFDSTGTAGNIILGGDFEPGNASPTIIASSLRMEGVRFERNAVNNLPAITVLTDNDLEAACYCDGTTVAVPFFDVKGSNNKLRVFGSGGVAAIIRARATRNITEIPYFHTLISPAATIYYSEEAEPSNVLKVGVSAQANGTSLAIIEAYKSELVPSDLAQWVATDCVVAAQGLGYRVTVRGSKPSLTFTPPAGTYIDLKIACTSTQSHAAAQAKMSISGGPATTFALGNGWPGFAARKLISTFKDAAYVNPSFTIEPLMVANGTYFDIYFLRSSQTYSPE